MVVLKIRIGINLLSSIGILPMEIGSTVHLLHFPILRISLFHRNILSTIAFFISQIPITAFFHCTQNLFTVHLLIQLTSRNFSTTIALIILTIFRLIIKVVQMLPYLLLKCLNSNFTKAMLISEVLSFLLRFISLAYYKCLCFRLIHWVHFN